MTDAYARCRQHEYFCIVDSHIGSVRSTEAWALAQHTRRLSLGPGSTLGPGRLGALSSGSIGLCGLWALLLKLLRGAERVRLA